MNTLQQESGEIKKEVTKDWEMGFFSIAISMFIINKYPQYSLQSFLSEMSIYKNLRNEFFDCMDKQFATARAEGAAEVLQIIKGVTYYVEYPVETFEYDRMAGKVIVGSHENPIEMLSKRDVEVFNATAKMIWGKVNKNIEALTTKEHHAK
jgi:hypothetical protein